MSLLLGKLLPGDIFEQVGKRRRVHSLDDGDERQVIKFDDTMERIAGTLDVKEAE